MCLQSSNLSLPQASSLSCFHNPSAGNPLLKVIARLRYFISILVAEDLIVAKIFLIISMSIQKRGGMIIHFYSKLQGNIPQDTRYQKRSLKIKYHYQ